MSAELNLRNKIHDGTFRFDVTPELWNTLFASEKEHQKANIITVVKNGILKGYAVLSIFARNGMKVCAIMDFCADGNDVLPELLERIIEYGVGESVDFLYIRKHEEPQDDIFDRKGFFSVIESVITMVLLDPKKLLTSLSEEVESGKDLKLVISGFDPIIVKIGKKGIKVVEKGKPNFTILTDEETFLKLFFGKTSPIKELLRRKLTLNKSLYLPAAIHFFSLIKHKNWYIPLGDWC